MQQSLGPTEVSGLDVGLLSTAFRPKPERGAVAVLSRPHGEPLEQHIRPAGGSYLFTRPGVEST